MVAIKIDTWKKLLHQISDASQLVSSYPEKLKMLFGYFVLLSTMRNPYFKDEISLEKQFYMQLAYVFNILIEKWREKDH